MATLFSLWNNNMSITIYDGIKLIGVNSLSQLLSFVEEIRPNIIEVVQKNKAEEIKSFACYYYDMYHTQDTSIADNTPERIPLLMATDTLMSMGGDREEYSISFSAVDGITYAIPFFPNGNGLQILNEHSNVKPFHYWDNIDPDESVTELEWNKRELVWEKIFETSGIPKECMCNVRLLDATRIIPDDRFMETLPTVEQRENRLIKMLTMDQAERELSAEGVNVGTNLSILMSRGDDLLPKIKAEITGTLKPITFDDLSRELPPVVKKNP